MIARVDMSALVMEFDHNVDTPKELEDAYWNFYQTIREKIRRYRLFCSRE